MSFVDEFEQRATPFEKKYYNYLAEVKDPMKREAQTQNILQKDHMDFEKPNIEQSFNPHEGFVNAYNERMTKKKVENVKEASKVLYNEEGKRFARPWDYAGFTSIHDPIGVFEKKANYEDLAWKVFNDVDDKDVYLKTLYYPQLTSDDLHLLFDRFEQQLKSYNNKVRFSYLVSAGSVLGTWALAYRYRFKFSTFLFSTVASFFAVQYGLSNFYSKNMKSSLNNYANDIARKYPQIKYSTVHYTKSSEIVPKKLI